MSKAGPFPWSKISTIEQAIAQLKHRSIRSFRHGLTRNDLLHLLAKPKDREVLQRVAKITSAASNNTQIQEMVINHGGFSNISMRVELPGSKKDGFLIPNYVGKEGFQTDLPDDVKERVNVALDRIIKNDLDWRYVKAVTDALVNRCKLASQVKLIMPTIVSLFRVQLGDQYPADDDYADKLYNQSLPREMPAIPPELRKWGVEVGATITKASMLPFTQESKSKEDEFKLSVTVEDHVGVPWEPNYALPKVSGYSFGN
jgi:hypothetical protein